MTPRAASLQVAHQKGCANQSKTALTSAGKRSGCTCKPSYYVLSRDHSGAKVKSERVRDRKVADSMLNRKQVELDEGRVGVVKQRNIAFPDWIDEYEAILERRVAVKGETRRAYAVTLRKARAVIGYVDVRAIGQREIRQFHDSIKKDGASDATQIKHLTQLGACLSEAVAEGYADTNPIGAYRKRERLRAPSGTPPFTDGEYERLVAAMADEEPVYVAMVKCAVEIGARVGELVALDWRNVNLTDGTVTIEHTYNPADGLIVPKDRDARTIYLTESGVAAFGAWLEEVGARETGLVFQAPRSESYVNDDFLRKLVNKAIKSAGIPKLDARSGRPRKPFHSLRATYTRRMLEAGRHPSWVESNLGHSDLRLTMHVYGTWSDEAMRTEAARS
jgi:integrase